MRERDKELEADAFLVGGASEAGELEARLENLRGSKDVAWLDGADVEGDLYGINRVGAGTSKVASGSLGPQ